MTRVHLLFIFPRRILAALLFTSLTVVPAAAQSSRPVSVLIGVTVSQDATLLPGVAIVILDEQGREVARLESDERGQFQLETLRPGRYAVTASAPGFTEIRREVTLLVGREERLRLELQVAQVEETVNVQSASQRVPEPAEFRRADAALVETLPLREPTLEEFLPMLPGVIRGPAGLSIKGGTPLQSSLQVGSVNVTDPATNASLYALPAAGLETLEVLPNPYSPEYGRFSSGVVVVEPRRGGRAWRFTTSNLLPGFKRERGSLVKVIGFSNVAPSVMLGGPLIADKLFLAQSLLARYVSQEVRSRPFSERRKRESFNSFTRLDANLGRHLVFGAFSVYPDTKTFANLDTFTPPEAAYNVRQRLYDVILTDRIALRPAAMLETSFHTSSHNVRLAGQDPGIMTLAPSGVSGRYFNDQTRRTLAHQWVEVLSVFRDGPAGPHLFKAGVDVLHARLEGESTSLPIEVRRANGTLARRIEFGPTSSLDATTTDVGLFAQDRWQPSNRMLVDGGLRFDRDGVTGRWGVTSRAGVTYALRDDGTVLIGGGAGLFFERVPTLAATFDELEPRLETWFDARGTTPVGPPTLWRGVRAPTIKPPHSLSWNVHYEHKLSPALTVKINYLQRRQRHDMTVNPVAGSSELVPLDPKGPFGPPLLLSEVLVGSLRLETDGHSAYREIEINPRYQRGDKFEVNASYTYARARSDLNLYSLLFAVYREPIIQPNEHAPTATDVPNRVTARMRWQPRPKWSIVPIIDWRQGLRYTAVDEEQRVVGARNAQRFPSAFLFDIVVERRIRVKKWRPWVGARIVNLFAAQAPLDVQNNTGSPEFGQFFNDAKKGLRVSLRFER